MPDLNDDDVAAMCTGKVAFDSHDRAQQVARRRRRNNKDKFECQVPYKCRSCRKWHIGTSNRGLRQ